MLRIKSILFVAFCLMFQAGATRVVVLAVQFSVPKFNFDYSVQCISAVAALRRSGYAPDNYITCAPWKSDQTDRLLIGYYLPRHTITVSRWKAFYQAKALRNALLRQSYIFVENVYLKPVHIFIIKGRHIVRGKVQRDGFFDQLSSYRMTSVEGYVWSKLKARNLDKYVINVDYKLQLGEEIHNIYVILDEKKLNEDPIGHKKKLKSILQTALNREFRVDGVELEHLMVEDFILPIAHATKAERVIENVEPDSASKPEVSSTTQTSTVPSTENNPDIDSAPPHPTKAEQVIENVEPDSASKPEVSSPTQTSTVPSTENNPDIDSAPPQTSTVPSTENNPDIDSAPPEPPFVPSTENIPYLDSAQNSQSMQMQGTENRNSDQASPLVGTIVGVISSFIVLAIMTMLGVYFYQKNKANKRQEQFVMDNETYGTGNDE